MSKHYLLLSQKLVPLRIAASGGRIPLDDEEEKAPETDEGAEAEKPQDAGEDTEEESEDEVPQPKKKKAKKEKRYSEFAYRSKLEALIAELERARDEDPHGMCDCRIDLLLLRLDLSHDPWFHTQLQPRALYSRSFPRR